MNLLDLDDDPKPQENNTSDFQKQENNEEIKKNVSSNIDFNFGFQKPTTSENQNASNFNFNNFSQPQVNNANDFSNFGSSNEQKPSNDWFSFNNQTNQQIPAQNQSSTNKTPFDMF